MRFAKISVTKRGVHLTRETRDPQGAVESIDIVLRPQDEQPGTSSLFLLMPLRLSH